MITPETHPLGVYGLGSVGESLRQAPPASSNRPPVRLREFPESISNQGFTVATLEEMAKLARAAASDPSFVQWARDAVRDVPSRDYLGELRALFDAEKRDIKYRKDPVFIEWLTAADHIVRRDKQEDCDGFSIVMIAGAMSIGHGGKFRIVKADPQFRKKWSHVYAVPGFRVGPAVMWFAADASQDRPFGWEPPHVFARADFMVFEP